MRLIANDYSPVHSTTLLRPNKERIAYYCAIAQIGSARHARHILIRLLRSTQPARSERDESEAPVVLRHLCAAIVRQPILMKYTGLLCLYTHTEADRSDRSDCIDSTCHAVQLGIWLTALEYALSKRSGNYREAHIA